MESFTDIVVAWGRVALAEDLGVPKERVRGWERFDTIPACQWKAVLEKAPARGLQVTPDLLISLAARD